MVSTGNRSPSIGGLLKPINPNGICLKTHHRKPFLIVKSWWFVMVFVIYLCDGSIVFSAGLPHCFYIMHFKGCCWLMSVFITTKKHIVKWCAGLVFIFVFLFLTPDCWCLFTGIVVHQSWSCIQPQTWGVSARMARHMFVFWATGTFALKWMRWST